MSEPTSFVLHADGLPAPRQTPALGDDRPKDILGQPCLYAWKPMLKAGEYVHPQHGWKLSVTPDRLSTLHAQTRQLLRNGYKPFVPEKHRGFDAKSNFGWVIETKVEDGTLWGLHQLIGTDAHKAAARNESSVCIKQNYRDGKGNVYPEVIEHNALCPDPVAGGLGGFIALSASANGPQDIAPVYVMAADQRSSDMPLTAEQLAKVKKIAGLNDVTDENAVDRLIAAAAPKEGVVAMSVSDKEKLEREHREAVAAKAGLETRVAELSRSAGKAPAAPDPEILRDRADLTTDRINVAVDKGEMPRAFADKLIGKVKPNGTPNAFMLSRQDDLGDRPVDFILGLFAGEKFGVKTGEATGPQGGRIELSREPGGAGEEPKTVQQQIDYGVERAKQYNAQFGQPAAAK